MAIYSVGGQNFTGQQANERFQGAPMSTWKDLVNAPKGLDRAGLMQHAYNADPATKYARETTTGTIMGRLSAAGLARSGAGINALNTAYNDNFSKWAAGKEAQGAAMSNKINSRLSQFRAKRKPKKDLYAGMKFGGGGNIKAMQAKAKRNWTPGKGYSSPMNNSAIRKKFGF